ncbi:bacillolysin [Candidatus Magnetomorum sp. HK-1]|nr:bacillolysin [Candidatus Magnetomorum sp. HK-1]
MKKTKYLFIYATILIFFYIIISISHADLSSDNTYSADVFETQSTHYTCEPAQGIYTYDYEVIWAKVHDLQDGSPGIIQFRMSKPDSPLTGGIAQVRMNSINGPVWHEWTYGSGLYTTSPVFSLPLTFTSGTIDFFITVKNFETYIHSGRIQVRAEKKDSMPELQWELPQENSVVFDPLRVKFILYDKDLIKKATLALLYKKTGAHKNIVLYETETPSQQTVLIDEEINIMTYDEIKAGGIVAGIWSIDGDENVGYSNCICPLEARDIYLADTNQLHIFSMSPDKLVTEKKQTVKIEGTGFTHDVTLSVESKSDTIPITEINVIDSNTLYCTIPDSLSITIYDLVIYNTTELNRRTGLFSVVEAKDKMKAIIVAASKVSEYFRDPLWDAVKLCADYGYQSLLEKGYSHDEIIYLSPEASAIVDNRATQIQLQNALLNEVADADNILLYMVGHGSGESFIINHYEELTATKLDEWLDDLQSNRLSREIIVIYDACDSGTFHSYLKPPEFTKRYVITSTSENEKAYFINKGKLSFSFQFWAYIRYCAYLDDAFFSGRDMVETFQKSLLDANGNGIPNEKQDKELSDRIIIGSNLDANGNGTPNEEQDKELSNRIGSDIVTTTDFPKVKSISAPQIIYEQTSAKIWVSGIVVENQIQEVMAVILQPDEPGVDNPQFDIIQLSDENNDNKYEAVYDQLDRSGEYIVSVYAVDSKGKLSEPILTTITKKISYEGDIYENDNHFIQARHIDTPQAHDFHQDDDIDWVYFYGIQGEEYIISASSYSPVSLTLYASDAQTLISEDSGKLVNLHFQCPSNDIFFVKVEPLNNSVAGNESQFQLSIQRNNYFDAYEHDDTHKQARKIVINNIISQTHNFHQQGDEDWVKFYAIKNNEYAIEIKSPENRCDAVLEIFKEEDELIRIKPPKDDGLKGEGELLRWTCNVSGLYFVKISSFDPEISGEETGYFFRIYSPEAQLTFQLQGLISGRDGTRISNVYVEAKSKINNNFVFSGLTDNTGIFHIYLDPAQYTVSMSKGGYRRINKEINGLSVDYITLNEILDELRIDMNKDGIFGLSDVIHLLHTLSIPF